MHAYASDSLDRSIAPWVIGAISICIAFGYANISSCWHFSMPWWLESPSILGVYGLLHSCYDRHLWKEKVFGIKLSQIPDCSGTWYGSINSTHNGGTQIEGMLTIHQTWTKILIKFESSTSKSMSRMASFNVSPGVSNGLIYEYTNAPGVNARDDMHAHRGLSFMNPNRNRNRLEGDYYTGRDRGTQGTMLMRKVSSDLLDLEEAAAKYHTLQQSPAAELVES